MSEKTNARLMQLTTALRIKKNLGLRSAIGFMRIRRWSPEATVWWLLSRSRYGK